MGGSGSGTHISFTNAHVSSLNRAGGRETKWRVPTPTSSQICFFGRLGFVQGFACNSSRIFCEVGSALASCTDVWQNAPSIHCCDFATTTDAPQRCAQKQLLLSESGPRTACIFMPSSTAMGNLCVT